MLLKYFYDKALAHASYLFGCQKSGEAIYAQIGGGAWMAVFTFVGAMLGMFSYAALKPKLPH